MQALLLARLSFSRRLNSRNIRTCHYSVSQRSDTASDESVPRCGVMVKASALRLIDLGLKPMSSHIQGIKYSTIQNGFRILSAKNMVPEFCTSLKYRTY